MYWSLMTFTTAGHADIVSPDASDSGKDWEVAAAIVVAITATFAYIYINANFTTMMIRLNSQLEQYRAKLAGIDAYLSRNKVSKDVQKRVKRHFSSLHSADASAEKALLETLPYALQKEVLQDIHMRTLRRAPTLFRFESPALSAVCAIVRTVSYLAEEILSEKGDVITEMYFLEEGCIVQHATQEANASDDSNTDGHACQSMRARVLPTISSPSQAASPDEPRQFAKCAPRRLRRGAVTSLLKPAMKLIQHRGTPMCEAAFLFGLRQEVTLEAIRPSKCCALRKSDFLQLLKEGPAVPRHLALGAAQLGDRAARDGRPSPRRSEACADEEPKGDGTAIGHAVRRSVGGSGHHRRGCAAQWRQCVRG